jgi:NADH-quinone oxidoreductase subunit B
VSFIQNQFEENFVTTSVDYVFNWARKSAIWPLTFGLACCAIEMIASSTSRFDIARFGAEVFRPAPPIRSHDCRRLFTFSKWPVL